MTRLVDCDILFQRPEALCWGSALVVDGRLYKLMAYHARIGAEMKWWMDELPEGWTSAAVMRGTMSSDGMALRGEWVCGAHRG